MPAARFWRVVGVETQAGGDLELSALHLYDAAGRADAAAVLTCSHAPLAGSLADLQDDDANTSALFAGGAVRSAGFWLKWDLGAPVDVYAPRLAGPSAALFVKALQVQYSDDGATWSDAAQLGAFVFPGEGTLTPLPISKMWFSSAPGEWTERTAVGSRYWQAAASSADGLHLVAGAYGGYIYTSADGGATWTERTAAGSRGWLVVASSADGLRLVAGAYGGYIYTSADGGATWTERTAAGSRGWRAVASSADGLRLVAGAYGGYIYTSADGGATWTERTAAGYRAWYAAASSADGLHLVAGAYGGYIYTSADGGATWTERTAAGSRGWLVVASSADGLRLVAGAYGGYIYTISERDAVFVAPPLTTARPAENIVFAEAPVPAFSVSALPAATPWRDMEFSGKGFIAGTVKRDADPVDVPLRRRVRLHRDVDGLMVRETWSDAATGAYRFDDINEAYKYTVVTYDHLHDYRAVIADNITPELLP